MRSFLQELFGIYLFAQFSTWKRLQSLPQAAFSDFKPSVNDNGAAEVFSLMSAKIEQLENQLNAQKQAPRIESKTSMDLSKLKKD